MLSRIKGRQWHALKRSRIGKDSHAKFSSKSSTFMMSAGSHTEGESAAPPSFIERAKVSGANALLGQFTSGGGFDRSVSGLTIDRITDGSVKCSFPVQKGNSNAYGTVHGGCLATLVDVVGTLAILSRDPLKAGVSVDLNVSYCSASKIGNDLSIEGKLLKMGKRMAFTEVTFMEKGTNKIVATGRHTKAL